MNTPPTADTGEDVTVEAEGPTTAVALQGTATDAEGDELTYEWTGSFAGGTATGPNPIVTFDGLGRFPVTLTVSDGSTTTTDEVIVTVEDTTAPAVTVALTPEGRRRGSYVVATACADTVDATPDLSAELNGAPVEDGDEVRLRRSRRLGATRVGDRLLVRGPSFELTGVCEDASGNRGTAVTGPPT